MIKKSPSGLVYVGNYRSGRVEPRMEHLVSIINKCIDAGDVKNRAFICFKYFCIIL